MQDVFLKLFVKMEGLKDRLIKDENGQDIVEYAVVVSLIALAATVSMKTLATTMGTALTAIGTKLTTYTS